MHKLKFLKAQFDTEINPKDIPSFRGAMIAKVGKKKETLLFHNHLSNTKFNYAYPLVQYKTISKRPTLVCMGEGVEAIHKFFEQRSWDLDINGKMHEMQIHKLDLNQFTVQVWDKEFEYQIRNWLPINQGSYEAYNRLNGLKEKVAFLEKKMVGHILAFAKGIGWRIPTQIKVTITEFEEPHLMYLKNTKMMAFTLKFKTTVFLPNYIGLGKSSSIGFGIVREVIKHNGKI